MTEAQSRMLTNVLIAALVLGGIYIIGKGIIAGFKGVTGIGKLEEIAKAKKEALKKKIEKIKKMGYLKKVKFTIGRNIDEVERNAKAIANSLWMKMKGANSLEDHAFVFKVFEDRLKTLNDIRAVYKAFGVRDLEDLGQWVYHESMPEDWKTYIITRISKAIA